MQISPTLEMKERVDIIFDMIPPLKSLNNGELIAELALTICDDILQYLAIQLESKSKALKPDDYVTLCLITSTLASWQFQKNNTSNLKKFRQSFSKSE